MGASKKYAKPYKIFYIGLLYVVICFLKFLYYVPFMIEFVMWMYIAYDISEEN